jgi:hypothetical protein
MLSFCLLQWQKELEPLWPSVSDCPPMVYVCVMYVDLILEYISYDSFLLVGGRERGMWNGNKSDFPSWMAGAWWYKAPIWQTKGCVTYDKIARGPFHTFTRCIICPLWSGGFWSIKVKAICFALLSLHAYGHTVGCFCYPSKKACEVSRMARAEKRHTVVKSFLTSCGTKSVPLLVHKHREHGKRGISIL